MRGIAIVLLYPTESNFQLVGLRSEINGWTRAVASHWSLILQFDSITLFYWFPF